MKKVLLGLVLALVFSSLAQASNICTPITISVNPTNHDDGNGPAWNLGVQGSNFPLFYYSPGAVINAYGTTWLAFNGNLPGYANVYAGFNGCNSAWTLWVEGTYKLYDNTLKEYIGVDGPFYYMVPKSCGVVISCSYTGQGPESGAYSVEAGHQYIMEFHIIAYTSVGTSQDYFRSVTVNIH